MACLSNLITPEIEKAHWTLNERLNEFEQKMEADLQALATKYGVSLPSP